MALFDPSLMVRVCRLTFLSATCLRNFVRSLVSRSVKLSLQAPLGLNFMPMLPFMEADSGFRKEPRRKIPRVRLKAKTLLNPSWFRGHRVVASVFFSGLSS